MAKLSLLKLVKSTNQSNLEVLTYLSKHTVVTDDNEADVEFPIITIVKTSRGKVCTVKLAHTYEGKLVRFKDEDHLKEINSVLKPLKAAVNLETLELKCKIATPEVGADGVTFLA